MEWKIVRADVNGMENPLGIDEERPVFHFTAESSEDGDTLTAAQFIVLCNGEEIWNSGRQVYAGSAYCSYGGNALKARTEYEVKITAWNKEGTAAEKVVPFETGFMGEPFAADWIEPVQEPAIEEKELSFMEMLIPNPAFWGGEARLRESKQLRRSFTVKGPVKKARIYATAHGVYNLYVNGKKVSERRLAPEISAYQGMLYYQTYDVTDFFEEGENVLGVLLADGWWIGRISLSGDNCNYGDRLGFLMQLEIEYEDDSREIIVSDESFSSRGSYIRYADLSIGEKWDMSAKDDAWMKPGYDASGWTACIMAGDYLSNEGYSKKNLVAQPLDPLVVTEELKPVKIFRTPKQELIIDFGQVIAGVCRFTVDVPAGTEISFEHGEVLDKEGNYINNIIGRNKDQKDVLLAADGRQVFEPQFTYHGFRYVRVHGITQEQLVDAAALVIGSPIRETGTFTCSNAGLNQLQHNIKWSTRGNMFSIPTDCPQREKMGWTGDIQVFTRTGAFNYDLRNFLNTWMKNVRIEQCPDGEIPVVVPNLPKQERAQRMMSNGSNSSAAWGDACVLVPYYLYQCYGDSRVLEENFDTMEKWLSYIKKSAAKKPEGYEDFTPEQKARNPYLWTKQYHFGDWLIPSLRALPNGVVLGTEETAPVVASCFYAITVECFIRICEVLGKEELAAQYQELLANIRRAVREEYVAEDGTIHNSRLQGLYVVALRAGIVEGGLKQKVLDRLVALIEENGGCLDTGFVSVSYLLDVLYDNGRSDIAYKLLFQTKAPSWLYMVGKGATSIWENWLAVLEDGTVTDSSYNHYAFGCVGDFMYRHIGGITKGAPGYKQILFTPDFSCGLDYAGCSLESPYGRISLDWVKTKKGYDIKGEVPVGTTAELRIGACRRKLFSGRFEAVYTMDKRLLVNGI